MTDNKVPRRRGRSWGFWTRFKVELWLLFPIGLFMRNLPTKGKPLTTEAANELSLMFGTAEWGDIYKDRRASSMVVRPPEWPL